MNPAADARAGGIDALFADERGARWTRPAFLRRVAPDAILQRDGAFPVSGAAAIAAAWADDVETLTPSGGDMASSRDLAYTFGTTTTATGSGHYVHLWTRDATGTTWRIAVAIRLP